MLGLTLVYKYEIAETLVTIRVYSDASTPTAWLVVLVVAGPWTYRTIRLRLQLYAASCRPRPCWCVGCCGDES